MGVRIIKGLDNFMKTDHQGGVGVNGSWKNRSHLNFDELLYISFHMQRISLKKRIRNSVKLTEYASEETIYF